MSERVEVTPEMIAAGWAVVNDGRQWPPRIKSGPGLVEIYRAMRALEPTGRAAPPDTQAERTRDEAEIARLSDGFVAAQENRDHALRRAEKAEASLKSVTASRDAAARLLNTAEAALAAAKADNERLREALEPFAFAAKLAETGGSPASWYLPDDACENARTALAAIREGE